jgi:PQQ-dependent dehydrogenase (methanol/ethanol family)
MVLFPLLGVLGPVPGAAQGSSGPPTVVDAGNVGELNVVFSFRTGQRGGHSGQPVAAGGLLFVQTPYPHVIDAFDVGVPEHPIRWTFTPRADGVAAGLINRDASAGGPVLAGDRLFINTFDGHTMALEAATGQLAWDVATADPAHGQGLARAPIVAGDEIVVGNVGDDFGARGWIEALDAATGALRWKRFNTGPDREVGIGAAFSPPYANDRQPDRGVTTWPPHAWLHGGGGSDAIVFDVQTGMIFHGTGHPAPWNPEPRPGDNRWTSGVFARDAATGDARWFVPVNSHDLYALGAGGSLLPAQLDWRGERRNVLIHPDANGQVYVLDRASGHILSAAPFVAVNATDGVDPATGALRRVAAKGIYPNTITRNICPSWSGATGGGGTSLGAAAYSADTGLLYIPVNRLCMDMEARDAHGIGGTPFTGANLRVKPASTGGALIAWDVAAEKQAWSCEEAFPVESGVLATDGGLVFYGTLEGQFKALDARTGRLLWQFKASSGIVGTPVSFRLPDGRAFIAVMSGMGGAAGQTAHAGIDIRDATAALGYANAMQDLKPPQDASGTLYVFALP